MRLIARDRQARLNDLDKDLGLDDQGYNTAVALLTVGYVLLPMQLLYIADIVIAI